MAVSWLLAVMPATMLPSAVADEEVTAEERAAEDAAPPSPEQIAGWIEELDSNQYQVREQATTELLASGDAALDPLIATANGDRPEPADRAVWILQRLGQSKDPVLRRHALERLEQLEGWPHVVAAARDALAQVRHAEAVETLRELGAQFHATDYGAPDGRSLVFRIVLDDRWTGGDAGMKHLRHLQGLQQVQIVGTDITAVGMAELQHVELLDQLLLYGTPLEPEGLATLRTLLPQAEIDYRRGALLGVAGRDIDGSAGAHVTEVRAETAAAVAGIQVQDVIRRFEGEEVLNFRDLTEKIATHGPGDEVTVEVEREGETLSFTVTLGQWQSDQLPGR